MQNPAGNRTNLGRRWNHPPNLADGLGGCNPLGRQRPCEMKSKIIAIAFVSLLLTGCTSVYTSGCVTTVQNRFFGIQVTSTTATSQMPQITVGAGSSFITVYPTSTNQMYCAPFFSTATAHTTWNPFRGGSGQKSSARATSQPPSAEQTRQRPQSSPRRQHPQPAPL